VAQVIEYLPSKHKTLSSIQSTDKKNPKPNQNKKQLEEQARSVAQVTERSRPWVQSPVAQKKKKKKNPTKKTKADILNTKVGKSFMTKAYDEYYQTLYTQQTCSLFALLNSLSESLDPD
jgi:hypothetical protein